jgi:hypothetical protein
MYVWELVSSRLRGDGWSVWHTTEASPDGEEPIFHVHVHRRGRSHSVSGPTLTEAYAVAARHVREQPASERGLARAGSHRG